MKANLVGAALVILVPSAHALMHMGPNELTLIASAGATYDSNILGGTKSEGDTFLNFNPGLNFSRKAGVIELTSNAGVNFTRYFDHTEFDSEDVNAGLRLNLSQLAGSTFQGSVSVGYNENATVMQEINARVHSDTLTASANGQIQIGNRLTLSAGTNSSVARRSGDSDQTTIGANSQLSLSDFLRDTSAHVAYAYMFSRSDAGRYSAVAINQTSHQITAGLSRPLFRYGTTTVSADFGYRFVERSAAEKRAGATGGGGTVFNAGIDGPFLPAKRFPKLHSHLNLSYSQSAEPGLNDTGQRSLQGAMGLDWEARPNTQVGVAVTRARTLTITNLSSTDTSVDIHGTQTLWHNLSATANASYSWTHSPAVTNPNVIPAAFVGVIPFGVDRDDKTFGAGAGITYSFARVWTSSLRYDYRSVSSTSAVSKFDHHMVNFNVACTY